MLYITVPDRNDSMSTITIDSTEFLIRFTYNETGDYWNFGLYNMEEQPFLAMTKIVPNFPLTHFYTSTDLPDGTFGALSNKLHIGRQAFNEKKAEFTYIPNAEVK